MKIKVKLKLRGEWYWPENDCFALCTWDFRQYFNVGIAEEIDLVISHTKPRSPACYRLSPLEDDCWRFSDCKQLLNDEDSPWGYTFDEFLDENFGGQKPVYVSAEI